MKRTGILIMVICMLITACGSKNRSDTGTAQNATAGSATDTSADTNSDTSGSDITSAATDSTVSQDNSTESDTSKTGNSQEDSPTDASPTLLYQGHASLRIVTAEEKVIYIDPFAGEGYDLPADLILITHAHADHTRTDLIQNQNPDCRVITQSDALQGGTHRTFDFDYVTVEAVEAGYNANHDASQCVGYLLTFTNGEILYVSGDTSTTPQMESLSAKNIDYAFFCCDGVYNMDAEEASACAEAVQAKHNIPYHTAAADKSVFDRENAERFHAPGALILEPGEERILN